MGEKFTLRNKIIIYVLLILLAFCILFPFYWIITTSLKNPGDITGYPPKFIFNVTFENYRKLFFVPMGSTTDFSKYYINSLIIAGIGTILSLIIGGSAGYALTRARFKKEKNRESIAFTLISFWFGPELAIILPQYVIFRKLGLIDTHIAMIIAYQLIGIPFVVWLARSFFKDVPLSLEEAARVDGYSPWRVFWKITFPLVKNGLAATSILTFIFQWNNFIFALVLAGRNTMPVTTGSLGFISYEAVLWGQMAAAIIISSIPQLILALFVQRHMVRGLTFGAVKG
jgi:multiple sugar transport system permease protein